MATKRRLVKLERHLHRTDRSGLAYRGISAKEWLAQFTEWGVEFPELAAEPLYAEELERLRIGIEREDGGVTDTAIMTLGAALSWCLREDD